MLKTIKANVLLPLATRIGTGSAFTLVGWGVNAEHANWVGIGVTGAVLIGIDLGLSWVRRWKIVSDTLDTIFNGEAAK